MSIPGNSSLTDIPPTVLWPIDKLIPFEGNARTHSDEQIALIAKSMITYKFTNPILVAPDGVIIAGHARLQAARKLGLTEVPVRVLDYLTPTERRALVITDNQVAITGSGWNDDKLRAALEELRTEEFDLESLGFSEEEIAQYLTDLDLEEVEGQTDEDAVPEPAETAITVPGDLWILGNHRVLCGDATVLGDVEKVLGGGLADMAFLDPPYNVNYGGNVKPQGKQRRKIANDNLGADFEWFLYDSCTNLLAVTKGAVYICMSSSELHTLQRAFIAAGGHWSTFIIWAKNTFTLGRSDYQRQYEPILYGWKEGTDHYWCGARDQGDVWFVKKPVRNEFHPTSKPVELVERALRNSSKTRDVVLDSFGGSGSTLIAAEKAGRQARLIELDPLYVDTIVRRFQEFAGREATLETDGRTFAEVSEARAQIAS